MEASSSSSGPAGAAPGPSSNPATAQPDTRPPIPETPSSDPNASAFQEKVKKRPSKVSLLGKRKNNSPSNSKRGNVAHIEASEGAPTGAAKESPSTTKSPKRRGGFLAFLNCCGGSQRNEDIDLNEHPVPVSAGSGTQAPKDNSTLKQDKTPAESSTADESKETGPEKIAGPPYSELKTVGEPKIEPEATRTETAAAETSAPPNPSERSNPPETSKPIDEKPPLPTQAIVPPASISDAPHSISQSSDTALDSDAAKSEGQSDGETAIDDRTSQQKRRDSDIEMGEAPAIDAAPDGERPPPPAAPASVEPEHEQKEDPTPPLPPPPPPDRRRSEVIRQGERNSGGQPNAPAEGQKWLLPPLRPEFKGKKCLVLDLDETLVHSSFKVGFGCPVRGMSWALTLVDTASGGLHDTGRDRGSVSQRICDQAAGRRSIYEARGRAVRSCRLHSFCFKGMSSPRLLPYRDC